MKNKQLRIIMVVVFALILAVTGLTTKTMLDTTKQFSQDGYVLVPSRDSETTKNMNEQFYFSAGTNYRNKYGQTIKFKDTSNNEVSMGTEEFVHYNDGSLGAFTKGVVMDLAEIGDNQVTYYGVSDKTTILKQGQDYSMSYLGNALTLNEFIWKISDDTYMLVSPQIVLHLAEDIEVVLEDYVQVQYVAGGIARLVHQQGTYQTVSDEAYIQADSGFELKLTERAFYNGLEKAVSLDEMVIDSSSNLYVDENEESLKIPTFRVVNGKDGADGADGFTGEDGTDGVAGESGTSGENGSKGQNGYDGLEGDSGEWGYDGQVGEDGKDAENSEVVDGIVGIVQESAPTVTMNAETFKVGANSVSMRLDVNDPKGLITGDDIECVIYRRDTMEDVYTKTIAPGIMGTDLNTDNLQPGVDYVLIVSGSYQSQHHGLFAEVNFFTKIFRTNELGLSIEKVQVTENSITVKVVKEDDSLVSSYGIALYKGEDDSATNITTYKDTTFTGSETFIFKKDDGIETGLEIEPNTEYRIKLTDIVTYDNEDKNSYSDMGEKVDVSKTVKTLKTAPYYLLDDNVTQVKVNEKKTKILTSSRYQTATVSLDTGIKDIYNGIKGYRYELYETSVDAANPAEATLVQTKEVQTMETVTFNIEPNQRYFARVVVLFNDNEKLVELVTNPSDVVSLAFSTYPTVKFISKDGKEGVLSHEYDKISGYVMVEDNSANQDMLLGHINADYPLIVNITAQTGELHTIKLRTAIDPPEGYADTGDTIAYYYFEQNGLARDMTHTVSVSGYVNDGIANEEEESANKGEPLIAWKDLTAADKQACLQYLTGYNVKLKQPEMIYVKMNQVPNVGDDLFTIALAFTDEEGNDASYEVANMEKITFSLKTDNSEDESVASITIGTAANLMDADEVDTSSDFGTYYYSKYGEPLKYTAVENQQYSQYILTDASFGAKGDLRIANGGKFKITVDAAYDYTQDDTAYPEVTNKLDIQGAFIFEVKKSHTRVADPNDAVEVMYIQNEDMETPNAALEDDTIVGLTVDTGYTLADVHEIIYYIYELPGEDSDILVEDDNPSDVLNKERDNGYWSSSQVKVKQKTFNVTPAEDIGRTITPWTVHFDQLNPGESTANIADDGSVIFERGKVYFIRYEIVTDGNMEDTATQKIYPNCVYGGMDEMTVPFYRSNVFGIERQTPTLQRYLWDTVTADGKTIHTWKYRLNDPDNAILEYVKDDKTNVVANITQYPTYEAATGLTNGTTGQSASLTGLYDENSKPKTTYESVAITALTNAKWYTVDIPYCLFENDTKAEYEDVNKLSILSVASEVKAVDDIITDVIHSGNADLDYAVNGVMVKEVSNVKGVKDEYGYRVKITLQGSQVERVAALKATVTGEDDSGNEKVVVYDPVAVKMQNGVIGEGANNFAYAYLEYGPIVDAGINHRDVQIQVEAYYTTNRAGMSTFTEYTDVAHTVGYTVANNLFANNNAWALKRYDYEDENGIQTYTYSYQTITDDKGNLQPCQEIYKDASNTGIVTKTLANSIIIPQMSVDNATNIGFTGDNSLAFRYAISPLAYSVDEADKFTDVMYGKTMALEMDEVGAKALNGSYYVLEQLSRKTLKIDFGDMAEDYEVATFRSGDGMPGISYSTSGSSTGMSSATVQFDLKGKLPGTDQGYYIYLYPQGSSEKIPLKKMECDGEVYYLVVGKDPTTDMDTTLASDDTSAAYALPVDEGGSTVTFAIRGLEKSTTYQVKLMARDTQDTLMDLFDFKYETGGRYYPFKTTSLIEMESSGITFVYDSYKNKYGLMNYAVLGSEGTGMRIFYKVYDESDAEVKCSGNYTDEELGYMLQPLGNNVKYYQSDMALCNPVNIKFTPGGLLQMGATYTVKYTAYTSTNAGVITNRTEPIGYCEQTFTTPTNLTMPRASMRVVSGEDSLNVTVVMYDTQKTIYNDVFYVDVYDLAGNLVTNESTQLKAQTTNGSTSTVYSGKIENLPANQSFRVIVKASVDRDNNGIAETNYVNELTANTISTATATVSTSYTSDGYLSFKLLDLANFNNVTRIVYSIDSQDGSTNYENADKALSEWTKVGSSYSYTTSFAPEAGTYHYTLQFYNGNALVGSTSGYFTK